MERLVLKALKARRESSQIDFKAAFDVSSPRDWCEILKDLVAVANSGGGVILVGVDNHGRATGGDVSGVVGLDPALVADKLYRYTETHFADFEILEATQDTHRLAAIRVGRAVSPIVFTKPGTYAIEGNRQRTAFGQGTVYFRHGAKSEPGNSEDVRRAVERRVEEIRKEWLDGVKRVVDAPVGSAIQVLPPRGAMGAGDRPPSVRIVEDASAPTCRVVDSDQTHPFRQKEVIDEVRRRLPDIRFNQYDVQAIRRVHGIDEDDTMFHKPRFGGPQYSHKLADWIVEKCTQDGQFLRKTREEHFRRKR